MEKETGKGVVLSCIKESRRIILIKEHFKFALLRDSAIDGAMKRRNHSGRDDNELHFELKSIDCQRCVRGSSKYWDGGFSSCEFVSGIEGRM